jgi:hypothetical protein
MISVPPERQMLGLKQAGTVVEVPRHIGMVGAERVSQIARRALQERPCSRKVALVPKQVRSPL